MKFFRIYDNTLYQVQDQDIIGFPVDDASYIPDDYLTQQQFVIMRTAHGIGDWGILSAMPRLLKQKYPNCKVLIPSENLLEKIFGKSHKNAYITFYNNPYIDGFVDNVKGEIFHDQYRIFDKNNTDVPLLEQMLMFWQFTDSELQDSQPEMYWTQQEKDLGDYIIDKHCDGDFGCLLVSNRFGTQRGKFDEVSYKRDTKNMTKVLKENPLPYFYWSHKPLETTPFNFIKKALNIRHISMRVQLYIKSKAKLNISNQCGSNHMVVRYSKCYESQRQFPIKHNFVKGEVYL